MQFNLVNNKEQVVQFVWGGMALALGFISILGGVLAAYVACACIISVRCFSVASLGSSSSQRLLRILCLRLRMYSWLCLSQCSVCWRSCAFPLTWVWVVGFSPQILEHPIPICDTGVNRFLSHKM